MPTKGYVRDNISDVSSNSDAIYFNPPATPKSMHYSESDPVSSVAVPGKNQDRLGWFHAKIRVENTIHWANNFGIQAAMLVYFLCCLAAVIILPHFGKKVSVGLLAGSSVTIVSASAVIYTYMHLPSWKKHPNPLIFYRSLCDLGFVFVLLFTELYKCSDGECTWRSSKALTDNGTIRVLTEEGCDAAAAFTQFFLLGSECWFAVMSYDMYTSVRSPFTDFKSNVRRYHIFVWGFALFTSILLVALGQSGPSEFNYCWTKPRHQQDTSASQDSSGAPTSKLWAINTTSWAFFYIWIILFWIVAICVIFFAWKRLKAGLAETLRLRLRVLSSVTVYVIAIIIYWAITFGVYVPYLVLNLVNYPDNYTSLMQAMMFFITCKGYFDFIVWFQINELSFGEGLLVSNAPDIKKGVPVDVDLSPQVNLALRCEVLYYTTTGIIQAAKEIITLDPAANENELHLLPQGQTALDDSTKENTTIFTDYCPHVFHSIRHHFGVSTEAYVQSLSKTTKERLSEGASGAFMFFSQDQQLIVKSMSPGEAQFLKSIAPEYASYLLSHPESLLTRFYGCHSVKLYGSTFYFVVMENLFCDQTRTIHRRYDIKGSWVNRSAKQPTKGKSVTCRHCNGKFIFGVVDEDSNSCPLRVGGSHEPNVILKDNDLTQKVRLNTQEAEELYTHICKDASFLASRGIMDYSLLMGVHNVEYRVTDDMELELDQDESKSLVLNANITAAKMKARDGSVAKVRDQSYLDDQVLSEGLPHLFNGGTRRANTVVGPACYYFGIIDILQLWNFDKKLERGFKVHVLRKDPEGLSAVPPTRYKDRFCIKMAEILGIGVHDEDSFPMDIGASMDESNNGLHKRSNIV
ncbi:phosphatidylinositol-4-phosphate-5-kinase (Pi-PIPK-D2) [Thraustotheca clavata]|uniref:Phosphatidylinositol-4-phosphate-5-kinase (Pi-PIPK-D2) n=1 Tax=Thraustotheca clavata TaxID=74557 RepID=A0A1V9ZIT6_9STRA|nr:phosphatidylinositol-4-phosphate-5-kinase (Pi-PIPK-D2) [Thraustotheca clavata]